MKTDKQYLDEIEDYFVNNCGDDNEPLTISEMRRAIEVVFEILDARAKLSAGGLAS